MNKGVVWLVGIIGLLLVIVAIVYFMTPASSLPSFFPGHQAGLSTHHYKHGIGSLFLGLACFAFAWFQSGKKSSSSSHQEQE
ncbi:MAG: hypothetical protein ACR2LN_02600 [Candidatus Levyibacteriota bacterium]